MVSMQAFYSDDLSSSPAEAYSFYYKFWFENNKNKQKRPWLVHLKRLSTSYVKNIDNIFCVVMSTSNINCLKLQFGCIFTFSNFSLHIAFFCFQLLSLLLHSFNMSKSLSLS